MSWPTEIDVIDHIAKCLETAGTRDFCEPFFEIIDKILGVDQCMVFMLSPQSRMTCLLSINFLQEGVATPLAKAYIEGGYQSDPAIEMLTDLATGQTRTIHLRELLDLMSEEYREQFFSDPGLLDKVTIMKFDGRDRYYINLYRGAGRHCFAKQDLFANPVEGRLIAAIVANHFRQNDSLRNEGPLAFLSDRERQVCLGILAGKKMEAIAANIGVATNSVITYRKRAYTKLGITSRGALFALCREQ
jgi:DNA-binding CsgD family transcriptional regulator